MNPNSLQSIVDTTLDWWIIRTPLQALLLMIGINIATAAMALLIGHLLVLLFASRRVVPLPGPPERNEILLAISCILLTGLMTFAGWALWRAGVLTVRRDTGLRIWLDAAVLILAMDLAMYILHRIAHHPRLYPWLHKQHHRYEAPQPIDLFVLNPLESISFGALWLLLLCVYPSSLPGIALYMGLNLAWGIIGHLGVEPVPESWQRRFPLLRLLGTSTFHAGHHQHAAVNYGFYTTIWDSLLGTASTAKRQ